MNTVTSPLLGPLVHRGFLDHVSLDALARVPGAKLFGLVTTIDENPHLLHGLHELVERVLATVALPEEVLRLGARLAAEGPSALARTRRDAARRQHLEFAEALRGRVVSGVAAPADAIRAVLKRYIPSALTDGRLLQFATNCTLTHLPLGLALVRLQGFEMGEGDLRRHPANQFRLLCASLDIADLEVLGCLGDAASNALEPEIGELGFEKAIFGWSLSLFPRLRMPELLGFTLAQYAARIPPLVLATREHLGAATSLGYFEVDRLDSDTTPRLDLAVEAVECLLAAASEQERPEITARIATGMVAHRALEERFTCHAWSAVDSASSSGLKVARILASRRDIAQGFHTHVRLGRERLDDLLSSDPDRFDAGALLDALARSRYVVRGSAARSPLVRAMTDLDGPMFRVFTRAEIAAIAEWIDGLPSEETALAAPRAVLPIASRVVWRTADDEAVRDDPGGGPPRDPSPPLAPCPWWAPSAAVEATLEAYAALPSRTVIRRLLDIEAFPDARVFARHFMQASLAKAQLLLHETTSPRVVLPPGESLPPEFFYLRPYSPERLDELLASQATLQRATFEAWNAKRAYPSRDQLTSDLSGGMPAGLIDGAWLQYVAASELLHDVTTCRLYRIYEDELGNGDAHEHHGNILRRLLAELGVPVPDIVTSTFEEQGEAYSRSNCAIALLWLCISLSPRHCKPELLGLNLGIESWGVGGSFRISEATLQHHRLDPLLPRLHNAIDNYLEGHTGWAKAAVHRLLARAFRTGGDALRQQLWERVWTGYALWSLRHQLSLDVAVNPQGARPRAIVLMPS